MNDSEPCTHVHFHYHVHLTPESRSESRSERKSGARPKPQAADTTRFDEFWAAYPRKVAKAAAQKAWVQGGCDNVADVIIAALANHPALVASDKQFVPHPATWLNQRRWEDEAEPKREAIDLKQMICDLEAQREQELKAQDAYLRETGILSGDGSPS